MKKFSIRIETLTPVCVGDGNKLSPFADYIFSKDGIHYIDQNAIKKKMAEDPKLIDLYVAGMLAGKHQNTNSFSLKDFIHNNLKMRLEEVTLRNIKVRETNGKAHKKELYTIVKNPWQHPYLPGSTIKGAIKTALLYNWLLTDKGKGWCVEYLNKFNQKQVKERLEKDLEETFKNYRLAVSDSTVTDDSSITVLETNRWHLKKAKSSIPQTWEAIQERAVFHSEIRNAESFSNMRNDQPYHYTWSDLCLIINTFSGNCCRMEWDLMERMADGIKNDVYWKLERFYNNLLKKIETSEAAYLRLGCGKGVYFNSIALALYDYDTSTDKQSFVNFLKLNEYGKIYSHQTKSWEEYNLYPDEFPMTRVVESLDVMPLGWVKIERNKD